jgi:hypothetical protein
VVVVLVVVVVTVSWLASCGEGEKLATCTRWPWR